MPGIVGTGGVTGDGARFIMRLQFGRGQATRWDELLQINRQLQGHRTYFLPGGAFLMGYKINKLTCKESLRIRLHSPSPRYIDYTLRRAVHVSKKCLSLLSTPGK